MKKSIIRISVYVLIAAAITVVMLSSCTGTRPMSSCDYVRQNFGGYK